MCIFQFQGLISRHLEKKSYFPLADLGRFLVVQLVEPKTAQKTF